MEELTSCKETPRRSCDGPRRCHVHAKRSIRIFTSTCQRLLSIAATNNLTTKTGSCVKMSDDAVSSSARGAGFLILLQISSRALTFALNQVLLRFLSPALLGASVQLELFIISAHHFARESLRVACQRQPEGGIQAAINLSYLGIAGGFPIVLAMGQGYLSTKYPDVPYFVEALRICQLAALVELFSEPAFVAVQQNMLYKTRAAAEASAVVFKTFVTAAIVFWSHYKGLELGVLPFAAGELTFCGVLTLVYLWQTAPVAKKQGFSLLPKVMKPRCVKSHHFNIRKLLSDFLPQLKYFLCCRSLLKTSSESFFFIVHSIRHKIHPHLRRHSRQHPCHSRGPRNVCPLRQLRRLDRSNGLPPHRRQHAEPLRQIVCSVLNNKRPG